MKAKPKKSDIKVSDNWAEDLAEALRQLCADVVERDGQPFAVDRIAVEVFYPEAVQSREVYSWRAEEGRQVPVSRRTAPGPPAKIPDPATLSLTLRGSDRILGSLVFHRAKAKGYTELERHQADRLARQLARLLDNRLGKTRAGNQEKVVDPLEDPLAGPIDDIANVLLSGDDGAESYREFARQLRRLAEFDWAAINVIDRENGMLSIRHLVGTATPGRLVNTVRPLAGSQTQAVLTSGKTMVRDDISAEIQFPTDSTHIKAGLRSVVKVPIYFEDRVIGVLSLRSRRVGVYDSQVTDALERLARRIGPYIEECQLFQQLQVNVKELALVNAVAPILTSTLNLTEVFDSLAQAANRILPFDRANLYWIESNGSDLQGLEAVPEGSSNRPLPSPGGVPEIATWLTYQQETIGQLVLTRFGGPFHPPDQVLLNHLGVQMAPALQNTRVYQQTERQIQEFQSRPGGSGGIDLMRWASQLDQTPLVNLAHEIRTPLTAIKG